MRVRAAIAKDTLRNPTYALVPIISLPVIDLSRSVGAELLPQRVDAFISYCLETFNKPLMFATVLALFLSTAVTVVEESTGQILSLISITLGFPFITASICTLRYDIVRLALRTFEFWSFFVILTWTTVLYTSFIGDLRIPRVLLDWLACLHSAFIDAQVYHIRNHITSYIVAIAPVSMMLIWSMLGRIYGGTSATILTSKTQDGQFVLDTLDIMGNGLLTLILMFVKISYRKRKSLWTNSSATETECAILQIGLRLDEIKVLAPRSSQSSNAQALETSSCHDKTNMEGKASPTCANIIQRMSLVKTEQTFVANCVFASIKASMNVQIPTLGLIVLYYVGLMGLLLACATIILEWIYTPSNVYSSQACVWISLICTVAFIAPFIPLYHRKLLQMLVFSFDFAFYSFQITSANLCVAILYHWNSLHVVSMVVWWVWAHWVLTLDALTPAMRTCLHLRIRYAALVITLLLAMHIAFACCIFLFQNLNLADVTVWEGTVWKRHVKISVLPYYFSRVATMLLWCLRLVWRLTKSSDNDMLLIRSAACYENVFANIKQVHPQQSHTAASSILTVSVPRTLPADCIHKR